MSKPCPPPANTDPRRKNPYIPPNPSRSEPLSHSEYLRRLKSNNNGALSSPNTILQVGEGKYARTIWTQSKNQCGNCSNSKGQVIPAVNPGGRARDASMTIMMAGATAARGSLSKYDLTNRTEWNTTYRRQGLAIIQDPSYKIAAGATPVDIECTPEREAAVVLQGTTDVVPGNPSNC